MKEQSLQFRLAALVLAAFVALSALAICASPTTAEADDAVPCAYIDTVLDCYTSFTTANNPEYNIAQYNQTYKNISYRNGYSLTGTSCLWTTVGVGPNGKPGYISRMQCNYNTY